MSPLLQASVQSQIPDLKCNIEEAHKNIISDTVGGSRAEIGLVVYWIVYGLHIFLPIQFAGWLTKSADPTKDQPKMGMGLPDTKWKDISPMQLSLYRSPSLLDHLIKRELTITQANHLADGQQQYTQGLILLFIAIIVSGFVFWFNMYKANKFVLTKWLKISAGVILCLGVVFSAFLGIWASSLYAVTGILLLPIATLAFGVFYGLWSTNDYQIYEP